MRKKMSCVQLFVCVRPDTTLKLDEMYAAFLLPRITLSRICEKDQRRWCDSEINVFFHE